MSAFQSVILRFLRCISDASFTLSRPVVLVPLVLLSLLQLVLFSAYVFFASPPFSWVTPGAIAYFGGESLLHYPAHLLALPETLVWIRVVAWVCMGFWVVRSVGRAVWERLDDRGRTGRDPVARQPVNAAAVMAATSVLFGAYVVLHWSLARLAVAPVLGRFGLVWSALDVTLAPLATMVLVDAWIAMGETRAGPRGIVAGVRMVVADAAPAVLVAIATAILAAPFQLLVGDAASFVKDGRPGVAVFAAAAALILDAPLRAILFASAVSLVIGRREGAPW